MRAELTLRKLFALGLVGLVAGLGLLFWLIQEVSRKTLLESGEQYRNGVGDAVAERVQAYVGLAPAALARFENQVRVGLVDVRDPASLCRGLAALLLTHEGISEVSFTSGTVQGFDGDGYPRIAPGTAGATSVFRSEQGEIVCRRVYAEGGKFLSVSSRLDPGLRRWTPPGKPEPAVDPTDDYTFKTPAARGNAGQAFPTDLHWSHLDDALPEARRRVEMSVVKAMPLPGSGQDGASAGVLKVGLLDKLVDGIAAKAGRDTQTGTMAHRVFLCDSQGRLVTGFGNPGDHIAESGDDLRMVADPLPPEVALALRLPDLAKVGEAQGRPAAGSFRMAGHSWFYTFHALAANETQDWIVAVVDPEEAYLGALPALRHRLLGASFLLILGIVAVGGAILRGVGRAHARVAAETAKMNDFDFSPTPPRSRLADIREVLGGLERAKTAMRAMGKYVPVGLVRRLYCDGREPVLGGVAADITLLFTDIEGFTATAEATPPDLLARLLGDYLDAVAAAIQAERGTIDKYIGDAVMAFWNAPEPLPDHPVRACRAALRCRDALARLYASPAWEGRPRFRTRYGLHRDTASVGHFGAADRFNYTAIGDGVNLASRLEGLNKAYGTEIVVSETVHAAAKDAFAFRLLDRVAVKGKTRGVAVYELLGEKEPGGAPPSPAAARYEEAFALYQRRDFGGALGRLRDAGDDVPSHVLAERCRRFQAAPPPPEWDGVHPLHDK